MKDALTERRSEQQLLLMADLKDQLKKSTDRIASTEKANMEPVDLHMEVTILAFDGLQAVDGKEEMFASKMAERIMAGIGGDGAKEVLKMKERCSACCALGESSFVFTPRITTASSSSSSWGGVAPDARWADPH